MNPQRQRKRDTCQYLLSTIEKLQKRHVDSEKPLVNKDDKRNDENADFMTFEAAEDSDDREEAINQKESECAVSPGRPKVVKTGKRVRPRKTKLNNIKIESVPIRLKRL